MNAITKNLELKDAKICLFGNATNIHFRRWAISLKNMGYNVFVISFRKAELPNIKVYDISCTEMRKSQKYKQYVRIIRGIKMFYLLRHALKKIKPDIVHIHYLINTPLVFGFCGLKKLIVSPWGNDIIYDHGREPLLNILYKKNLLRWADEITTTTKYLSDGVKKYEDCSPFVIPFGVDTSIFSSEKKYNGKVITLSFIKHLEEKYGPKYLIEAVPLILNAYKNIKVIMVGSGSQRIYLENLVKKLGIQSYVSFLGKVNHKRVIDILRVTDIFVMPSVYKSDIFGVAAIEASAMKIPVVASNFDGIKEAVVDSTTGLLVPPRDVKAIADACIKLIQNKSLRKNMGENGRNYVKRNFEWKECVEKMVKLYERALLKK